MVDISSLQQDSIVVQSLQSVGGAMIDASNNFYVNTSMLFLGNTTSSVILKPSGIYSPSLQLDDTTSNLSINTSSLMLTTSTANLYIDVNGANFPGDVSVTGSILLTGSFVANGTNGNTGDVLVSDGTISYWSSAANNSTYAYGKTENNLNVNNSTYAYGKTENNLNVNNSLTSNTASYLGSSINTGNSSGMYSTGVVTASGIVSGLELTSTNASGDEGGQINLAKPPNATTAGGIVIDAYQNKLRIYENGGNFRGAYIDLTSAANGVATNLLTGGGGGTGTVTSVGSGNGLTGGPITASGTLSVLANNGIIANSSGVFVDQAYSYSWTNTHSFSANAAFTGNNISVVSNTGSVMFGGSSDTNWRIGRSTGATTKFYYSNNTLDIIAAASNLEGVVIGQPGGNTYLETGYAGTFTKNPIYVGNATVNVSINSTSFSGTSNNASYLGGTAAANFVQNTDSRTLSGNLYFTGANSTFSGNLTIGSTGELIITNGAGIYANGTLGTNGQFLSSTGSGVYWANSSTFYIYYANGSIAFSGSGSSPANSGISTGKSIAMAIVFGG